MKTINIIIIYLCCSVSIFAAFDGGTGTATDPYLITTREHLIELRDSIDLGINWSIGKHFKVMNDITDPVKTMIGNNNRAFQGVFDGNGKTITLAIDTSIYGVGGGSGISLFRTVGEAGIISDVIVDGSVIGYGSIVAGIVGGLYNGVVERCVNNASIVSHTLSAGGIVGENDGGNIHACINNGSVVGNYAGAPVVSGHGIGGIAGINTGRIIYCINNGSLVRYYSAVPNVGGIVGDNRGMILRCTNIGTIESETDVGGIVGFNVSFNNGCILHCINSGLVIGLSRVGGIAGYSTSFADSVRNCLNIGVISSNNPISVGSITGNQPTSFPPLNSYYDKQMSRYGGLNNADVVGFAEGRLNPTGFALESLLGVDYIYEDCLYPRLGNEEYDYVQASPVFLYIGDDLDYDTHDDINHCFMVSTKYGVR